MTTTTPVRRLAAAIGAATLILSGCSTAADTTTTTTTTTAETTTSTTEPVAPPTVVITTLDYAYSGLPTEVKAGTTFTLVNESDTELHEFVAVRLADDDSRTAAEIVSLPPDELGALFANVSTVLLATPGSDEAIPAVGNGTLNESGRYVIVCAIPTGANPQEYLDAAATSEGPPEVDGGPPHFVHGMFGEVIVTD